MSWCESCGAACIVSNMVQIKNVLPFYEMCHTLRLFIRQHGLVDFTTKHDNDDTIQVTKFVHFVKHHPLCHPLLPAATHMHTLSPMRMFRASKHIRCSLLNRIVTKLHARDHISIGFDWIAWKQSTMVHVCVLCTARHISPDSHDVVLKNTCPTDTQRGDTHPY